MKPRLIAILRDVKAEDALGIVQVLIDQGITELEISLSNEETGLSALEAVAHRFGTKVRCGVGTVLTPRQLRKALDAGADFVITPAFDPAIVDYCLQNRIEVIPGVFTPGEVMAATIRGIEVLKLFPANALPLNYIKTLNGPFPKARFLAVGGVSIETAESFLKAGFIGLAPGNDLVRRGATLADLETIAAKAKAYRELCERYES